MIFEANMSNFDLAIPIILQHEGHFSNDPHDCGGATNFGISLRWLQSIGDLDKDNNLVGDLNHDEKVDINDIKMLTREDAINLYRTYWWDKYHYEKIVDQQLANKVFDLSVNMGAMAAHRCTQRAIRAVTGKHLVEDGDLGNITLDAINCAAPILLLVAIRCEAAGFYRALNKPRYIEGWLNRAYS